MRVKGKKLVYNVLVYNMNKKSVQPYNILNEKILTSIQKDLRKNKVKDRKEFKAFLKEQFNYLFAHKSEYEMVVADNIYCDNHDIINAFNQIDMNLDIIIDYIIKETNIKFKKEKK